MLTDWCSWCRWKFIVHYCTEHAFHAKRIPLAFGHTGLRRSACYLTGNFGAKYLVFSPLVPSKRENLILLSLYIFWGKCRVSVQGVKSLGGHFACLCRGFEFYEVKKIVIIFQKENGNTFTLLIIFMVKSLQKEQNSTNLLWPPICRNKSAITPKWFNSLNTNSRWHPCGYPSKRRMKLTWKLLLWQFSLTGYTTSKCVFLFVFLARVSNILFFW